MDGASKENPGVAGSGGIIRNQLGQTVLAFQEHLGLISNTIAELKTICRGVKLCIDSNIRKISVETDANIRLKLISFPPPQGPWHLQNLLQQIRNLLSQIEFKISHIFRKGNQVADYFAKQACFHQHLTILSPDNITASRFFCRLWPLTVRESRFCKVYPKEISKRMPEKEKARFGDSTTAQATIRVNEATLLGYA
ncbi:UNVERIFIED_CONTAM: hypothetical protein Sradi_2365200 [Sesamum radiatum]|uniref:RNase H type-1 domain-containing protein n=1 Tax=Sesamum radiatum TaxID=300843 RepID=A0AAW2T704_SESRA